MPHCGHGLHTGVVQSATGGRFGGDGEAPPCSVPDYRCCCCLYPCCRTEFPNLSARWRCRVQIIKGGKTIPVVPVLFSVGINELQSYAETMSGKKASALQVMTLAIWCYSAKASTLFYLAYAHTCTPESWHPPMHISCH